MGAGATTIERALGSEDAEERRQATAELSGLPVEAALSLLLRALGDVDWRVRKEATLAARAFGAAPALADALIGVFAESDDVGLRNAAVDVLAAAGPVATAKLAAALERLDADGRKLAVEALGKGRDPDALDALEGALDDPDDNVRQGAMEAIAALGALAHDRVARLLLSRLEDRDRVVRLTALEGLGALEVPIPWERLSPLVEDPTLRGAALSAAALAESPEAARALAGVLARARGNAFDLALRALGRIADGALAESVPPALVAGGAELGRRLVEAARPDRHDSDSAERSSSEGRGDETVLRRATALRLAAIVAAPGVVDVAVSALGEDALADAAQRALSVLGPAALPELIARIEEPGSSSSPEARAALVDVLGEIMHGGVSPALTDAALTALRGAVHDPEWPVAARALFALSRLGGEADLAIIAEATLGGARPLAAAAEAALAAVAARFPAAARAFADAHSSGSAEGSLLAAAIAIGAASGASPFEERDATFLARAATSEDARARRAAVHAVSEIRANVGASFPGAVEVLRVALTDEEHDVQLAAARALGRLCTARDALRASDVLDLVERSGESDLVAATVRAMGEGLSLGYAAQPAADLVPALGLFARGAPSPVAMAAVEALGQAQRAGVPSAVGALAAALDHADDAVVKAALLKLSSAASADGDAALEAIARALSHLQPAVRTLAVELLADAEPGHDGDARRWLAQRLATEPDRKVKEAIHRALGLAHEGVASTSRPRIGRGEGGTG